MDIFASRLASFNVTHTGKKKRASNSKVGSLLKWPHKSPAPAELAEAGFYFAPTSSAPDNTTCFVCEANIDGWEAQDNPLEEHIKFASHCGWAINRSIEQSENVSALKAQDPMSEELVQARRMTFRDNWPHEGKRGWFCKTQKMVDAGWYYCPTSESEDYVKCAYCCLSLDGWEPKDNPYTEHQRRFPDCVFFAPAVKASKPKGGRGKRVSKASSRLSTQSNQTILSEASSANWEVYGNDSLMTIESEVAPPSQPAMASTKRGQPKRASRLPKNTSQDPSIDTAPPSSFMEPEDDDFEIKVAPPPTKKTRGRKRKSDEVDEVTSTIQPESALMGTMEPPAKRRLTRSRNSVLGQTVSPVATSIVGDIQMAHANDMPPPQIPKSKTAVKGRRVRASSRARQVSTSSTASMASLRGAIPDDSALDAALEAELDRSPPKHGGELLSEGDPTSRKAHSNKTRVVDNAEGASMATVRNAVKDSIGDSNDAVGKSMKDIQREAVISKPKRRVVSRQKAPTSQSEPAGLTKDDTEEIHTEVAPKKRGPKSKKASRKEPTRKTREEESSHSILEEHQQSVLASSIIEQHVAQDDSEHETDVSAVQSQGKRAAPKRGRVPRKNKTSQNPAAVITDHAKHEKQSPLVEQHEINAGAAVDEEVDTHEVEDPEAVVERPSKTAPKPKKGAKSKNRIAKATTPPPAPPPSSPMHDLVASATREANTPQRLPTPASTDATPTKPAPTRTMNSPPSDVENQPPSSRPASVRPPLQIVSPSKFQPVRVPLALSTPVGSPSKHNIAKLQTTLPWTAIDLDRFFLGPSPEKENTTIHFSTRTQGALSSPEKKMTVEEWIKKNAGEMEERLRGDCERIVGRFEGEGMRALRTLEGVVCRD